MSFVSRVVKLGRDESDPRPRQAFEILSINASSIDTFSKPRLDVHVFILLSERIVIYSTMWQSI